MILGFKYVPLFLSFYLWYELKHNYELEGGQYGGEEWVKYFFT